MSYIFCIFVSRICKDRQLYIVFWWFWMFLLLQVVVFYLIVSVVSLKLSPWGQLLDKLFKKVKINLGVGILPYLDN